MQDECEVKILDINPEVFEKKILAAGAKFVGEKNFRRIVYPTAVYNKWFRLRTDGKTTTLTYKQIDHDGVDGTKEIETTVDDFEATHAILLKTGLEMMAHQENRRRSFLLRGACIEIDSWPKIPVYAEIEAETVEKVHEIVSLLGYSKEDITTKDTNSIYKDHGHDLDAIKELKF